MCSHRRCRTQATSKDVSTRWLLRRARMRKKKKKRADPSRTGRSRRCPNLTSQLRRNSLIRQSAWVVAWTNPNASHQLSKSITWPRCIDPWESRTRGSATIPDPPKMSSAWDWWLWAREILWMVNRKILRCLKKKPHLNIRCPFAKT